MNFHRVGLTGGVGAGKSEVAKLLTAAGVPVVNLDEIGRALTENDPALSQKINEICGLPGDALDRKRLREVLFADREVRAAVEGLLHPLILGKFEAEAERLRAAGEKLVVCEAALLVESGLHSALDELIVVAAPEGLRKQRLMDRDKIGAELAQKILGAQASEERKRALAGYVIDNDKDVGHLKRQVNGLLARWSAAGWWE